MDGRSLYQAWVTISQAAVVLERAVDARLRPLNLNSAQGMTLLALAEHGPQRMSYLARFLLQQTQTTTDLVDRLERRSLVRRIRHETDRRVVLVEISDEGRALLKDIREAIWSVGRETFGGLSDTELARLTTTARRVRDAAAAIGGVPADHLSYAEERLQISPVGYADEVAAD